MKPNNKSDKDPLEILHMPTARITSLDISKKNYI